MSRWTPIADLPTLSTFEPKLAQSVVLTAVDNVLGVIHAPGVRGWVADGVDWHGVRYAAFHPTLPTLEPQFVKLTVLAAVDDVLGVVHASCIPHWIADGPDRCCVCDAATELPAGSPREPQLVQLAVLAMIDDVLGIVHVPCVSGRHADSTCSVGRVGQVVMPPACPLCVPTGLEYTQVF